MSLVLQVSVCWHEGRYHGTGEWPPAPARLFQALLAGAAQGRHLPAEAREALSWMEQLDPPSIGAPRARHGQRVSNYVPNNDLDSVGGDPVRVSEIRTEKAIRPYLFDESVPLTYAWTLADEPTNRQRAETVGKLADQLYQLGRGVDQAWARSELLSEGEFEQQAGHYQGRFYRPSGGARGLSLLSPVEGSLASLVERFEAQLRRFETDADRQVVLRQAPPARFLPVRYDGRVNFKVFQLFRNGMAGWPLRKSSQLVDWVRTEACARLARALPEKSSLIERIFCGKKSDSGTDKAERIRVVPLPSIGHEHADQWVRRLLVEVPGECPLSAQDIAWAFTGLPVVDPATGEIKNDLSVAPADEDDRMLEHYGFEDSHCIWHSVTPLVLPESAARRRIEPSRSHAEAKPGSERLAEERRAATAVLQALRHADCALPVDEIKVQREPFLRKGERAERFAEGTRFRKERLWHVRIQFRQPVTGPLVLGDGRFLGLGLMAPERPGRPILAFEVRTGLFQQAEPEQLALALRRAVMALVQNHLGSLPSYFSGHYKTGEPVKDEHEHLAFFADLSSRRLYIFGPDRGKDNHTRNFVTLGRALANFDDLRAGQSGRLQLQAVSPREDDSVCGEGRVWESLTDYQPTRHPKKHDTIEDFLVQDIQRELARRNLPNNSEVEVLTAIVGPRRGSIRARLRLTFPAVVQGPIYLGRTSHKGGGLFRIKGLPGTTSLDFNPRGRQT